MTKLLNEKASGVYIISATPFNEDGTIDMDSADSLTDFYLDKGVDGITILGIMGEAPKLTAEESKAFMKHIIKRVNGRVPVVVGVSNAGMDNLAALANSAMDLGAAGVMVAPFALIKPMKRFLIILPLSIKHLVQKSRLFIRIIRLPPMPLFLFPVYYG